MTPWAWLVHVLGIDTQQSWAYDYWSGVGTQVSLPNVVLAVLWYRHNCCHRPWCPRMGKHRPDGTPYCRHHLPPAGD